MTSFLIILGIIAIVFLGIALFSSAETKHYDYGEEHERIAQVLKKEYRPPIDNHGHMYEMYPEGFLSHYPRYTNLYTPEEHEVTLKVDHPEASILKVKNQDLYHSVKEGDSLKVLVKEGTLKNKKLSVSNPKSKLHLVSVLHKDKSIKIS